MIYRFESFELDEGRYELRHRGEARALPCKSFDLLRYMLEHAGRVVTKEELFERFWNEAHVDECVLPVHVRTIRRTLGESAGSSILKTIRGRGYVIPCSVERLDDDGVASPPVGGIDTEVPLRSTCTSAPDPFRALAQIGGMVALGFGLGALDLVDDSLELLSQRAIAGP